MPNYGYGKQSRDRKKIYQERSAHIANVPPIPTHLEIDKMHKSIQFSTPVNYYKVLDGALKSYMIKAQTLGLYQAHTIGNQHRNLWHSRLHGMSMDVINRIEADVANTNRVTLGEGVYIQFIIEENKLGIQFVNSNTNEKSQIINILECENGKIRFKDFVRIMWHYNYQLNIDGLVMGLGFEVEFSPQTIRHHTVDLCLLAK